MMRSVKSVLCSIKARRKPLHVLIARVFLDAKIGDVVIEKLDDFDIARVKVRIDVHGVVAPLE